MCRDAFTRFRELFIELFVDAKRLVTWLELCARVRPMLTRNAGEPKPRPARSWRSGGDGAVEIVVAHLFAASEAVGAAVAVLSEDERARADRFAFDRDRRRFIVARARLRHLLAARLDTTPETIRFSYGARGKPSLRGSEWRFNVSHCGDLAVFAFCRHREVGVDVESVRPLEDADAIAARFFSPRENAEYRSLQPAHRPRGFFNCWTRKEAFIKATGDGLAHPLDAFDVTLTPDAPARILRVGDRPGTACGWSLECFVPAPGYVAAVVTNTGGVS